MVNLYQYPFEIRPLSMSEGGGFLITFPDFSECISDGETIDETIQNGLDALRATIAALESTGHPVPEPGNRGEIIQLPKSLYARLVACAKQEGLSINALVNTLISENIARHEIHQGNF